MTAESGSGSTCRKLLLGALLLSATCLAHAEDYVLRITIAAKEACYADNGVCVTAVRPEGAAGRAGMAAGDVLLRLGDSAISNPADVLARLQNLAPDPVLDTQVSRHGEILTLEVRFNSGDKFSNFYQAAIPPVDAADMQAVLDKDFQHALQSGSLAPRSGRGVTIGVLRHGVRRVFSYGVAEPDSIFEIGSVSKTFTGLMLAQLIEQHKVELDEPVRELLPAGTVPKPQGEEISLLDLVTHYSGLPRMPDNFHRHFVLFGDSDYRIADLYRYLRQHGVAKPADAENHYSNLGVGLLGQALSNRVGLPYPQLLEQEVTSPLGLADTVVSLSEEQRSRLIQGHTVRHRNAPWVDSGALAGAGAIRSTAGDMLTYLEAQLHPEELSVAPSASPEERTLSDAIRLSHELRNSAGPGTHIAFAWLHVDATGRYWHNGGTPGYSSFVSFSPDADDALVVLVNEAGDLDLPGRIARHIEQRLAGVRADVFN